MDLQFLPYIFIIIILVAGGLIAKEVGLIDAIKGYRPTEGEWNPQWNQTVLEIVLNQSLLDYMLGNSFTRVYTANYTGDGEYTHAITGIGFAPKFLRIWVYVTTFTSDHSDEKLDMMYGNVSYRHYWDGLHSSYLWGIVSLDADGFTVCDGDGDADPNTDGQVYVYIAYG